MIVDWGVAPKWAKYHAFDFNGKGFWYKDEPTLGPGDGCWDTGGRFELSHYFVNTMFTDYAATLVERPVKKCQSEEIAKLRVTVAQLEDAINYLRAKLAGRSIDIDALAIRIQNLETWRKS